MSGLKVNFMESEVILINGDNLLAKQYSELFNCQVGKLPLKYLGVHVGGSRLHVSDWDKVDERVLKRLDSWRGKSMSIGGRTVLINSCLFNDPIYHMSMYLLPKTVIKKLDKSRRTFFWQGGHTKTKYHLVKWDIICKPKNKGGLGIKDLRKLNLSLLCKWWWKLENEQGIWQDLVNKKYIKHMPPG